MEKESFERRKKEAIPVIAICYDFDKTLSPDDMQAQGFIQAVGYDNPELFWRESNARAGKNDMDTNLSYMYQMIDTAEGAMVFSKKTLREYGAKVQLFPGVETWFDRIRNYGKERGVIVEHYVISSGLKEMIEGTSVAEKFEKIYASSFLYNEKGVAIWPAQVVNYTNKTQFLFRIEKGVLDINDPGVNDSFPPDKIRIPFRNIIYMGDSDTDIPCMKLVNTYGGHSIGVYNPQTKDKAKVYKMIKEQRIKYYAAADYTEESEIDSLVKNIIDKTVEYERLEARFYQCQEEAFDFEKNVKDKENKKQDLMFSLECSPNFATTHTIINELANIDSWTDEEKNELADITMSNSQIYFILADEDLNKFYHRLLKGFVSDSENVKKIKAKLKIRK